MHIHKEEIIGIVGGVGPYAGLDLVRKIFDQTEAKADQEHLSVALLSFPKEISDRTGFLLGRTTINPAYGIVKLIRKLEEIGASVVGIACNTAYAHQIFNVILEEIKKANITTKLVHMIDEVSKFIRENYPGIKKVGVLGTIGTYKTGIYEKALKQEGIHVVLPDEVFQKTVHSAIYDPVTGIKAQSNPVTETAKSTLFKVIDHLQKEGAEAIILGCTEISLALSDTKIEEMVMIDPTLILARALIREVNKNKLKPFSKR